MAEITIKYKSEGDDDYDIEASYKGHLKNLMWGMAFVNVSFMEKIPNEAKALYKKLLMKVIAEM